MATNLKETATHLSNVEGVIERGNTNSIPTNSGVSGLQAGQMFVNTDTSIFLIYDGSAWYGRAMS